MTSDLYHITHVGFYLFRFHIIITAKAINQIPLAITFHDPGTPRLILLVIVLLNFRFQKCRDPNSQLDQVTRSKPEPGLLRNFQLSSQNILFGFIKFSFSKVSRPESPTRPGWRIQAGARFTPTFSIIFSKHFVWFYSILDFLITWKHFILGKPVTFTSHLSYHNMHFQCNNSIHNSIYEI